MMALIDWWSPAGRLFLLQPEWRPRNVGTCRGCGAGILWVETKAGKKMPIDQAGTSHFATCPFSDQFRRGNGPPPFEGIDTI